MLTISPQYYPLRSWNDARVSLCILRETPICISRKCHDEEDAPTTRDAKKNDNTREEDLPLPCLHDRKAASTMRRPLLRKMKDPRGRVCRAVRVGTGLLARRDAKIVERLISSETQFSIDSDKLRDGRVHASVRYVTNEYEKISARL